MAADDPEGLAALLADTPWHREGDELVRDRQLADFAAAIAYVDAVAVLAERADHHPDLRVHGWNNVELRLTTHSSGGLTEKDVALARAVEALGQRS